MKIKVGKTYELANGVVRECTEMQGNDHLAVSNSGYGLFVVGGVYYHQDGTHGNGIAPRLNVIRCVDDDTPTLWSDMTPEEKGALLLAHHEGKEIEASGVGTEWKWEVMADGPKWYNHCAYRIKPEPKVEPKVETVTLFGDDITGSWGPDKRPYDTQKITLTYRDGKVDPVAQVKEI